MIRVHLERAGSFSFEAEQFRIDDMGRLVLLNGDVAVAVFAKWDGCWQTDAAITAKAR